MKKPLLLACALLCSISIAACSPTGSNGDEPPATPDQIGVFWSPDVNEAIERYLETQMMHTGFRGKVFVAFEVLDSTSQTLAGPNGEPIEVLADDIWVYAQEYVLNEQTGQLSAGTGQSGPLRVIIRKNGESYGVINHVLPRDGAFFVSDIRALMTPLAASIVLQGDDGTQMERMERLKAQVELRAAEYYGLPVSTVQMAAPANTEF